jgi:hypothetical protein
MTQIWALRSRLEKQPTDLRQNTSYFGDRTLTSVIRPERPALKGQELRTRSGAKVRSRFSPYLVELPRVNPGACLAPCLNRPRPRRRPSSSVGNRGSLQDERRMNGESNGRSFARITRKNERGRRTTTTTRTRTIEAGRRLRQGYL